VWARRPLKDDRGRRGPSGPFRDLADFASRINPRAINKARGWKASRPRGAFDTLEGNRRAGAFGGRRRDPRGGAAAGTRTPRSARTICSVEPRRAKNPPAAGGRAVGSLLKSCKHEFRRDRLLSLGPPARRLRRASLKRLNVLSWTRFRDRREERRDRRQGRRHGGCRRAERRTKTRQQDGHPGILRPVRAFRVRDLPGRPAAIPRHAGARRRRPAVPECGGCRGEDVRAARIQTVEAARSGGPTSTRKGLRVFPAAPAIRSRAWRSGWNRHPRGQPERGGMRRSVSW